MNQVAVNQPEMNLAVLVKRAYQVPEQMRNAQTEAFAKLFKGSLLKRFGRSLLQSPPFGLLVAATSGYSVPILGTRVSRLYTADEIADVLANSRVYESREIALQEVPNVVSRSFTDFTGAEVYKWEKVVNPKTNQELYYLRFDYDPPS